MARALTNEQERLRTLQIERNEEFVSQAKSSLEELELISALADECNSELVDFVIKMKRSHCNIIRGDYANFHTTDLNIPQRPLFDFYHNLDHSYRLYPREVQLASLPHYEDYKTIEKQGQLFAKKVKSLLGAIYSSNALIQRFEDMDGVYKQLEELVYSQWTYPADQLEREAWGGSQVQFVDPIFLSTITITTPNFVLIYKEYGTIVRRIGILEGKLREAIVILSSINSILPFADLKQENSLITNEVHNIQVGERVKIGDQNAIGKSAKVEITEKKEEPKKWGILRLGRRQK